MTGVQIREQAALDPDRLHVCTHTRPPRSPTRGVGVSFRSRRKSVVGNGWSRATRTTLGNQQALGARVIDWSPLTISGDNIEGSCTNKQTSQTTSVKHQPGATVKDQSQCVSRDLLAGRLRDMEPDWGVVRWE
jgi:hypothetical protein